MTKKEKVFWTEPDRSRCEEEGGRLSEKTRRVANGM